MKNISPLSSITEIFDSRQNFEDRDKRSNYAAYRGIVFTCVEEAKNISAMKDSIFDKITIGGVLQYMDLGEQIEFMKECRRIIVGNGIVKIRVPIIHDMALVNYYGWNIEHNLDIDERVSEPDRAYLSNSPKCNFTPFSITSLARDTDFFVTGAFLRDVYFYEIIFKKRQSRDHFSSLELVHNVFYCSAHRIGTTSELEYWAKCLDDGMDVGELDFNLKTNYYNFD